MLQKTDKTCWMRAKLFSALLFRSGLAPARCRPQAGLRHHGFLPLISADTPARNKLGGFLGVSATIPCYRCTFEGHHYRGAEKKGMYFCGYTHPSPQTVTLGGQLVHAWEPRIRKSDAAHRYWCAEVQGERCAVCSRRAQAVQRATQYVLFLRSASLCSHGSCCHPLLSTCS